MDPTLKAVAFVVALVLFVIEALRTKSIVVAGYVAFTLPFAWDAVEAA